MNNNYFRKLMQKNSINIFGFFHSNHYLKTNSFNLPILFSVIDFHKKICRSFYVIFLHNVFINNACTYCTWKTAKCRKSKTTISTLKNRPYVVFGKTDKVLIFFHCIGHTHWTYWLQILSKFCFKKGGFLQKH